MYCAEKLSGDWLVGLYVCVCDVPSIKNSYIRSYTYVLVYTVTMHIKFDNSFKINDLQVFMYKHMIHSAGLYRA